MALAVVDTAMLGTSSIFQSAITMDITTSGSNRLLTAYLALPATNTITSAQFDGNDLTLSGSMPIVNGSLRLYCWCMLAPPAVTANVVLQFSASHAAAGAIAFTGAHQSTAPVLLTSSTSNSSPVTFSVNEGDLVASPDWLLLMDGTDSGVSIMDVGTDQVLSQSTGVGAGMSVYTIPGDGSEHPSVSTWADISGSARLTHASMRIYAAATSAATAITLSGPSSSTQNSASTNFTAGADGDITGTIVVTPYSSTGTGSFSPTTVSISSGSPTGAFTYTGTSVGARNIGTNDDGGLANPAEIVHTVNAATTGKPYYYYSNQRRA